MLTYKGLTFCIASCRNAACTIRYTHEIGVAAEAWWGKPGAPISLGDRSARCADYQPEQEGERRGAA